MVEPPAPGTKYRPLYEHLAGLPPAARHVLHSFEQIERILGARLPPSAHHHQAWWSNGSNPKPLVEARAWLAAGWRTEDVAEHQPKEQMVFVRV